MATSLVIVARPENAWAARAFGTPRFVTNTSGDIRYAANTVLTCSSAAANCTAAQNKTINASNNNFAMIYVDIDGDASTFNSSSATLAPPPGSTVLWAGLYWSGISTNANRTAMLLDTPAAGGYRTVSSTVVDTDGSYYQAFADVTSLVTADGYGVYTGANVYASTGGGYYGGWSLVLAYSNPAEPFRNLAVFDGFQRVDPNSPVNITVSGFLTPPVGPVSANIGMIAYEGDNGLGGDYARFEGTNLSDGLNPATNFFNSTISTFGSYNTGMDPQYKDQLGFDAKILSTSGVVPTSATSADIELRSAGDFYWPGVVTTAIDIFVPNLTLDLTKSVTDLNGGDVHPGDVLEYGISFTNQGSDPGLDVVLTDEIPAGTTFVQGSLAIMSGDNPGAKTDLAGDDQGTFDGTNAVFRLGTGANAGSGGRIDPFASSGTQYEATFQVTVDAGTEGSIIDNQARVAYRALTTGDEYAEPTNTVSVDVKPLSDLRFVSKTDNVDPVIAGAGLQYTLTVANHGPSPAVNTVITDTLPAGVTFDLANSDPSCSAAGQVVTCNRGTLAAGTSATPVLDSVVIAVTVDGDTAAGFVANAASVASDTPDASPKDNTGGEKTEIERLVDLTLTKSGTPDPVVAGEAVTYTIVVTNNGPSDAANPTMVDSIPAGTSVSSSSATGGGACVDGASSVSCGWPVLAAGASETVTVVVDVPSAATDGSTVVNKAGISSDDPEDPKGDPNETVETVTVDREIDLLVTKASMGAAIPGTTMQYAITVENTGPSDATAVDILDSLPGGVTFNAGLSTTGCTEADGVVTCPVGDLAAGAPTVNVTIAVDLPSTMADGVVLHNEVTASADEGDSNTATDDTTTEREVDLAVAKTHSADPVVAGDTLTYTLTVSNAGPSDSTGMTVTDTLPDLAATVGADLIFQSTSPGAPTCSHSGGLVTCGGINLAAGASTTITIITRVAAGVSDGAVLTNIASVDPGPGETDTNPNDNDTTLDTQVERTTTLDVTKAEKAPATDPIVAGTAMTWVITVTNAGLAQDDNVVLTDDLSALPVTFQSVSPAGPTCGEAAGVITCDWASLAPGAVELVEITVLVDADAVDGTRFTNTATADGEFSNPATGVEETTINRVADLSLEKTGPATVNAGEVAAYTVTLTNNGPSNASNVAIEDLLPAGTVHVATRVITEPTVGSVTCGPMGGIEVCELSGELVPAGVVVIEVDVLTDTALVAGSTITNVVTAEADEDSDGAIDTIDTDVERSADMAISKTNPNGPVPAGGSITYDLVVTNNGPSDATNVVITDAIPAGLTFDPAASDSSCTQVDTDVVCNLGVMDPDDPAVALSLSFDVAESFGDGTVTNTASVNAVEPDLVDINDSNDDTTSVYTAADLAVLKESPAAAAVPGANYTYTVTVTNAGPSDAVNTVLTDVLPTGTSFVVAGSSSSCTPAGGGDVACNLGTMTPDASVELTIVVAIPASHVGDLTNTASVDSDTDDPTASNNTDADTSPTAPSADLALTKTASPDPVVAGEQVTYVLTVDNLGPSDAVNATITDILPGALSFATALSDSRCSADDQVVTCTQSGNFSPSDTPLMFTVVVDVASSVPAGLSLVNNATSGSDTPDPDPSNDKAQEPVLVERSADLAMVKTVTPDPVVAGGNVTYTLTITNNGPSDASGVSVTDSLPGGMTVQSATASTGSCSNTASSVSCGASSLADGATLTVTVVAAVAASVADGAVLVNSASVNAIEDDPESGNDGDTAPIEVVRVVGLAIAKTSITKPVAVPGENHTFEITVNNTGLSDASGISVTDTLPEGVTFVADDLGACTAVDQAITCDLGAMAAGTTATLVMTVALDPSLAESATVDNTAEVTSIEPDDDLADNTSDVMVPIQRVADLSVFKAGPTTPVVAGTPFAYTLTIDNVGPSDATHVIVSDSLPTGLTFISTGSDADCSADGQVVTCTVAALAKDDPSVTLTLMVLADAALADGVSLANTASVVADENDPDGDNNESSVTTDIARDSGLEIVKTDSVDPAIAGTQLTYTLTGTNLGPSVIDNVVITDNLPAGASFVAGSSSTNCDENTPGVITCLLGTMTADVPQSVTVVVELDPAIANGTQLVNTANIAGDDATGDKTTEETTINRSADVSLTKTGPAAPVNAGDDITWTLSLDNLGTSDASDVTITDPIPTGLTFVSSSSDSRCDEVGVNIVCTIGVVAVADPVDTIDLTFTVDPGYGSAGANSVTNAATVSGNEPDPDPTNDTGTNTTPVNISADLSLVKVSPFTSPVPGTNYTYSVSVANAGPSDAVNVSVTDTLPTGTSFVATGSSSTCDPGGTDVVCSLGTVASDSSVVFTIIVAIPADYTGDLTNSASVTSDTPDPDSENNADTDVSTADPQADLSILKTVAPSPVVAGMQATYELTVANLGPSTAVNVVATDMLPVGMSFVEGLSDPRCSASGQVVTCAEPVPLAVTDSPLVFTVVVDVASSVADGAYLVNAAEVESDTGDPDDTNDGAAARVEVGRVADLGVVKTVSPDPVTAGGPVTYIIVVANNGPSDATDVVVADLLPVGITVSSVAADVGTCANTSTTVTCSAPVLADQAVMTITVVGAVASSVADGVNLVNSASAVADEVDLEPGNDGATAPVDVQRTVDLVIVKTSDTKPVVVAGENHPFEISVRNDGPSDATGVVVTDTLPAGWIFVDGLSSAACSAISDVVSCNVGTVVDGGAANLVITALAPSDLADDSTITNSVSITSNELDQDPSDNSSDVVVPAVRAADLSVIKQGPTGPVFAGTGFDYTITVDNLGPSDATGVVVTDTLPAGATFVEGTSSPDCSAVGQALTCTVGTVADGSGPVVLTVSVITDSALAEGAVLENGASVVGNEDDPDSNNNDSSTTTDIERTSGLEIVKTDSADPAIAGTQLTYTLTVTNVGPSATDDVVVTDNLPPGASFVKALSSTNCDENTPGIITCLLGTVAVNDPQPLTVVVDLDPTIPAGDQLVNVAGVDGDSGEPVETEEETTIDRQANIWVTKVADPPDRVAGEPVTYTITVGNDGPSLATDIVVSDILPAGVAFQSALPGTPDCTNVGALLTCDVASLGVDATAVIELTVLVDSSLPVGADLTNNVSVAANETDPDPTDNSGQDVGTVEREVVLDVVKTAAGPVATAGENFAWTITVTNNGPSDASDVTVSDQLPSGVTYDAALSSGLCTDTTPRVIDCAIGTMVDGSVLELLITGLVDSDLPADTVLANSATGDSAESEPDTSTTETPVVAEADLSLLKTSLTNPMTAGDPALYELVITNIGPSTAVNVTLTDDLPAGLTFDSATSASSCASGVTCVLGDIPAGESVQILLGVILASDEVDPVLNTAAVSSDSPDPDASNNVDTDTADVVQLVDLAVAKLASATVATAGEPLSYVLTASNAGPSDATGVVVVDALPPMLTFIAADSSSSCTEGPPQTVTCVIGDLADGEDGTVTIAAMVDSALPSGTDIANPASISSDQPNSNVNPTALVTTPSGTRAGLTIDKSLKGDLVAGTTAIYSVEVTNAGPSTAADVTVSDSLPSGLSFVQSESDARCVAVGAVVSCDLGDLATGSTASADIVVLVDSGHAGEVVNVASATATADEGEIEVSDGVVAPVAVISELAVTKTPHVSSAKSGDTVVWDITVANAGPSTASEMNVVDTLPAGLTYVPNDSSSSCRAAGQAVRCTESDLAVGEQVTFSVASVVTSSAPTGALTNTAIASVVGESPVRAEGVGVIVIERRSILSRIPLTGGNPLRAVLMGVLLVAAGLALVTNTRRRS